MYRNAGHAFANPDGKSFHRQASQDAWGKLNAFFGQHLKQDRAEESAQNGVGASE